MIADFIVFILIKIHIIYDPTINYIYIRILVIFNIYWEIIYYLLKQDFMNFICYAINYKYL